MISHFAISDQVHRQQVIRNRQTSPIPVYSFCNSVYSRTTLRKTHGQQTTCSPVHVGSHNLDAVSEDKAIGITFKDSRVVQ